MKTSQIVEIPSEPSLLEQYRADPIGVRQRIAAAARKERSEVVHAQGARLCRTIAKLAVRGPAYRVKPA